MIIIIIIVNTLPRGRYEAKQKGCLYYDGFTTPFFRTRFDTFARIMFVSQTDGSSPSHY